MNIIGLTWAVRKDKSCMHYMFGTLKSSLFIPSCAFLKGTALGNMLSPKGMLSQGQFPSKMHRGKNKISDPHPPGKDTMHLIPHRVCQNHNCHKYL